MGNYLEAVEEQRDQLYVLELCLTRIGLLIFFRERIVRMTLARTQSQPLTSASQ